MAMDWRLTLEFSDSSFPELLRTHFSSPLLDKEIIGVRARYPSRGAVAIHSRKGPIALSVLALRIKKARGQGSLNEPILVGGRGSVANVVANILYLPNASSGIFGFTSTGTSILRRMIMVSNGRFERPALPISVFVRDGVLASPSSVSVLIDGKPIEDPCELAQLLESLESMITIKEKGKDSGRVAIAA